MREDHASAAKLVGGVLLFIGLASFGVLAVASRKLMWLERALDVGDVVVLGVFALFGSFCAGLGWRLLLPRADGHDSMRAQPLASGPPSGTQGAATPPPKRVTLSRGCAAAGVLLLMLSVFLPAHWHPVVSFFLGLGLLAVAHALTPCVERIEQLRKARASERQL